jgi:hypothetical protein
VPSTRGSSSSASLSCRNRRIRFFTWESNDSSCLFACFSNTISYAIFFQYLRERNQLCPACHDVCPPSPGDGEIVSVLQIFQDNAPRKFVRRQLLSLRQPLKLRQGLGMNIEFRHRNSCIPRAAKSSRIILSARNRGRRFLNCESSSSKLRRPLSVHVNFQAIGFQHPLERMLPRPVCGDFTEFLLGCCDVFHVLKVGKDSLPRVVGLRPAGLLR